MTVYDILYDDFIYRHYPQKGICAHVSKMAETYRQSPGELIVSDYLSGMTDSYALRFYEERFLPRQHGEMIEDY